MTAVKKEKYCAFRIKCCVLKEDFLFASFFSANAKQQELEEGDVHIHLCKGGRRAKSGVIVCVCVRAVARVIVLCIARE